MEVDQIKQALDRAQAVFAAKPAAACITKKGRATVIRGLECQYTEEGFIFHADMPRPLGGEGRALSPGGYASCRSVEDHESSLRVYPSAPRVRGGQAIGEWDGTIWPRRIMARLVG